MNGGWVDSVDTHDRVYLRVTSKQTLLKNDITSTNQQFLHHRQEAIR